MAAPETSLLQLSSRDESSDALAQDAPVSAKRCEWADAERLDEAFGR